MNIKTPIIPIHQTFAKIQTPEELNFEAICVFCALGFFLDRDTYWKNQVVLPPASDNNLDFEGYLLDSVPWFNWHYSPRDITFKEALKEFSDLFETIVEEQTRGKRVILPLSGGLDSRTQAIALKHIEANVFSYSYEFENGYSESKIAKRIADVCGYDFSSYQIESGYLWEKIDTLFQLNQGYSDFTTPRQMAFYDYYNSMGDVFSLGHWGDVLFDNMNVLELNELQQVELLFKKIVKRGGLEFASQLWLSWGLEGNFKAYLKTRITELLRKIPIENTNAKLRAFKSLYWAPRWTSINLAIFDDKHPVTLPYYDDRMCQFICSIPEDYLKDRKLQIEYIKNRVPKLAQITWEAQRPFNINSYHWNKIPYNVPYRLKEKLKRVIREVWGYHYVQRNWELQFLGNSNDAQLRFYLFDSDLKEMISEDIISDYYTLFKTKNPLQNAHAINMLLVLSKFNQSQNKVKKI